MSFYPPNSFYQPGVFKTWFSGPLGWATGTNCYFNSALSTQSVSTSTNATLTIYLRLLLVPRNPGDALPPKTEDGKEFPTRAWNIDDKLEFQKFQNAVKLEGDKFWGNTGFCLTLPSDYRGLDWPHNNPTLHPNVDCRFEIVWASGTQDAHAVIECFRPDFDNPDLSAFRSNAGSGRGQFTKFDTALRNTMMVKACEKKDFVFTGTDMNMEYKTIQTKCAVQHMTLAHELGHLIGLPHVGELRKVPDCMDAIKRDPLHGSGDRSCYTGPRDGDSENVMGGGMGLADWNAMPWALRLVDHLGIHPSGVGIALKSVPPTLVRARVG